MTDPRNNGALGLRADLARAADYRLLSVLLETPSDERQARLRALMAATPLPEGPDLTRVLAADDTAVAAEHFRVLGAAGPVSGAASDYIEGGYADKGPILGDIGGFYRAFGFELTIREAPDHFANLLAFLSFLAVKQAWTDHHGDPEEAEVAREAESKLLERHVHPYLGRFAVRLAEHAPEGGVYRDIAARVAALAGSATDPIPDKT